MGSASALPRRLRRTWLVLVALAIALLPLAGAGAHPADKSGLFYSDDEGETWTYLESSPPVASVYAIWIDPVQPGRLVVATELSLWLSEDEGQSWRPVAGEVDAEDAGLIAYAIAADPEAPERLWAATESGVLHSPDAGASWRPTGALGTTAVALLAVPGVAGTQLYAGTAEGLRVSLDDGQTWQPEGAGTEGAVLAIGEGLEGDLLVGTTSGLYVRSPEGGQFESARGLPRGPVRMVQLLDDGSVYAAVGATLFRREGGWVKLATLPLAANGDPPVVSAALLTFDDRLLAGTDHGLHRGEEWRPVPPFDELGYLETAPLVRDHHRIDRVYLGASSLPHQVGLARAGILYEPTTTELPDDRLNVLILLLFVAGGVLAARYLTRRDLPPAAPPPAGPPPAVEAAPSTPPDR